MKKIITRYLVALSRLYLKRSKDMKIIAVVGSVGKTSAKVSIGSALGQSHSVRYSSNSYNSAIGSPLAIFGQETPEAMRSPLQWLKLIMKCEAQLTGKRPDFLVIELGIDRPGEMQEMLSIVTPDVTVLTAATAEHLDMLGSVEIASSENMQAVNAAKEVSFINLDDTNIAEMPGSAKTFGFSEEADFVISRHKRGKDSLLRLQLSLGDSKIDQPSNFVSSAGLKSLAIGAIVADHFGSKMAQIENFTRITRPFKGRMRLFGGHGGSVVIDDTYNSSPAAIADSLNALGDMPQTNKIFVMGMVNEMGEHLDGLLRDISSSFKSADEVILVGDDLQQVMTPILDAEDVKYSKTENALSAAKLLSERPLSDQDVVLAKGSQGGVYLEECVKGLLADQNDSSRLVRQSSHWLRVKSVFFKTELS